MAFIQALEETIKNEYLDLTTAPLTETESGATCTNINLSIAGKKAFFKPTSGDEMFPFFKSREHLKVMCEKILFLEEDREKKVFVLCFELKSNNSGEAIKQMNAARIFAQFIFDTTKRVSHNTIGGCTPEFRGVVFSDMRPPVLKGTTNSRVRVPYIEDTATGLKYYMKKSSQSAFDVAEFCN